MKSTQMFVGVLVVIAVSVISGTEGIPRPQGIPKDYVEVDGPDFVFDGAVDRTRHTTPSGNSRTAIPTQPTPNTVPPTFTPTPAPTGSPVTPNPQVEQCVLNCRFRVTSEYNPVCGTDGIVYNNRGMLICANNCGRNVRQAYLGPCTTNIRG